MKILAKRKALIAVVTSMMIAFSCSRSTQQSVPGESVYSAEQAGPNNLILHEAVVAGDYAQVESLLSKGLSPDTIDSSGATPLLIMSDAGDEQMVQLLLKFGASPDRVDKFGNSALLLAVIRRHVNVVKMLVEKGANPQLVGAQKLTPCGVALTHHYEDILAELKTCRTGQ